MATHTAAIESIDSAFRSAPARRKTRASWAAWRGVASDGATSWRDGQLTEADYFMGEDVPFCRVYGTAFADTEPPSWICEGLQAVDREFPPLFILAGALSRRDFVAPLNPPAARIPQVHDVRDAALCILATRLLLSFPERLRPPAFRSAESAIAELRDASYLVAAVGGRKAISEAIRMAGRRQTYEKLEETDDPIEFGDAE